MSLHDFDLLPASKTTIGLPKTPANWVGKPKYTEIMNITVSCGGGMGGSIWHEYVDRNDYTPVKIGGVEMVEYTRWDGKKITLNPRWIVKIENFTLVTATYDSRNDNFPIGKYTVRYLAQDGQKFALVNSYER